MKNFFLILIFLFISICPDKSYAVSFTTFGNHTDWAMAVGPFSIQNFNNEANGSFNSRNFGGFTANLVNSAGNLPAISNGELILQSYAEGYSYLRLNFSPGIRALYFHWRNTDGDRFEMNIAGTLWSFDHGYDGTFDVIADGEFTWVDFYDPTGGDGLLTYVSLDNIYYSSELNPVTIPEPATLVLFSFFLLLCIYKQKLHLRRILKF